jgi:hypothetical protein
MIIVPLKLKRHAVNHQNHTLERSLSMDYHFKTVAPQAAQGTLQSTYATLQEMFMMSPT